MKRANRPDLVSAERARSAPQLHRGLDRLLQRRAVDDVEAQQLLLRLGEGSVDYDRLLSLPNGDRGGRRQQADRRPQPALLSQLLLDDVELGDRSVVLLFRPSADFVFGIVTKDGVEHGSSLSKDERVSPQPTGKKVRSVVGRRRARSSSGMPIVSVSNKKEKTWKSRKSY